MLRLQKNFYHYNSKYISMAKYTKEELTAIKKQKNELLTLLLKKTGAKHKDIVDIAEQQFISANVDVLTQTEKKQFNLLVF